MTRTSNSITTVHRQQTFLLHTTDQRHQALTCKTLRSLCPKAKRQKSGMRPYTVAIHFKRRSKAQHNDATEVNFENLRSQASHEPYDRRSCFVPVCNPRRKNWGSPNCLYLINEFFTVPCWLVGSVRSRSNSGKMRVYPHLCTANPEFTHHVGNINCSAAFS